MSLAAKLGRAEPLKVNESPDAEAAWRVELPVLICIAGAQEAPGVLVGFASMVRCSSLKGFIEALAI